MADISFDEFGAVNNAGNNAGSGFRLNPFDNPTAVTDYASTASSNNSNSISSWFQSTFSKGNIDTALNVGKTWDQLKSGGTSRPSSGAAPASVGDPNPGIGKSVGALGSLFSKLAQPNSFGSNADNTGSGGLQSSSMFSNPALMGLLIVAVVGFLFIRR